MEEVSNLHPAEWLSGFNEMICNHKHCTAVVSGTGEEEHVCILQLRWGRGDGREGKHMDQKKEARLEWHKELH